MFLKQRLATATALYDNKCMQQGKKRFQEKKGKAKGKGHLLY